MMRPLLLVALLCAAPLAGFALSDSELESIGRKVWQNECAGTREGLTSWNSGENFASLGIGHFIWYPRGVNGPFEESFPKLLRFFETSGVKLPAGLSASEPCPWATRAEFQAAQKSERMTALRDLLARTIRLQSHFLAQRQAESLPKMLAAAPSADRANVERQFRRLSATGEGTFALIDYVNFKGEGTKSTERYQSQGWGLLQVLSAMNGDGGGAAREFRDAAAAVLTRRVKNAPADRHEERWLPGWKSRVRAYGE